MSAKISEKVLENIDEKYIDEALGNVLNGNRKKTYKVFKSIGKVAACLGMVLVLSVLSLSAAVAAGNVTAYNILFLFNSDIAVKLAPVNVSCESNGIKMEVESIYVHGDEAKIYISMQDLTGDRIDETMDLFDSYNIHTNGDQIGGCEIVAFDAENKLATFLITVQQMDGNRIAEGNMTFSVTKFLSGKEETDEELPDISLNATPILSDADVQTDVEIRGGNGSWGNKYLKPNEEQSFSPVDGVTITAYGFIDDKLHVQVHYEEIVKYDNHGYVYWRDAEGNANVDHVQVSFWDEDKVSGYEEYVYDISPKDDLSEVFMWGHFFTCKNQITGNWRVTFPIENAE